MRGKCVCVCGWVGGWVWEEGVVCAREHVEVLG